MKIGSLQYGSLSSCNRESGARLPASPLAVFFHEPLLHRKNLGVGKLNEMIGFITLAALILMACWSILRFYWPAGSGLRHGEARVLRAYAETLLSEVPWGSRVQVDGVLKDIGRHLNRMPRRVRFSVQILLWHVDVLPWFLGMAFRRFSRLPLPRRKAVLARSSRGRTVIGYHRMAAVEAIQTIIMLSVGAQAEVLELCQDERLQHLAGCREQRARALGRQVGGGS